MFRYFKGSAPKSCTLLSSLQTPKYTVGTLQIILYCSSQIAVSFHFLQTKENDDNIYEFTVSSKFQNTSTVLHYSRFFLPVSISHTIIIFSREIYGNSGPQ